MAVSGLPSGASAAAPGKNRIHNQLTVAGYNIHHGQGTDDVLDLERIAGVIEDFDADIIGLQEVDRFWARSQYVDQPAWLAQRLGMHAAFGANLDLEPDEPGRPRREYGTLVLSRQPILSWKNVLLPRFDGHEQRGLLVARVNACGRTVTFANTHLQHNDNLEREAQAQAIVDYFGTSARQTVLAGDLNAAPGAPEIGILTDVFDDVWDAIGSGPGYTYPSEIPTKRIDYLMGTPDLTPAAASVDDKDPGASDHRPVTGQYTVTR